MDDLLPDPFLDFLILDLKFEWWYIGIVYALLSVLIDYIFLNTFTAKKYGGKERYKEYLKEKLSWLYWPIFMMGGLSTFYMVIANINQIIYDNLKLFDLDNFKSEYLMTEELQTTWVQISVVVTVLGSTYTLLRHKGKDLFFTKPFTFGVVRTILFDGPLGYMISMSVIRYANQLRILYKFYTSDWMPNIFINPDNYYGLEWAHNLAIQEIFIALVAGFIPLIMLTRKKMADFSYQYKSSPIIVATILIVPTLILFFNLSSKVEDIYQSNMESLVNRIAAVSNPIDAIPLYQQVQILSELPDKASLPTLLDGALGASLLLWGTFLIRVFAEDLFKNLKNRFLQYLKEYFQQDEKDENAKKKKKKNKMKNKIKDEKVNK